MDTFYELIDLTSSNVVGEYDSEVEALDEVRRFAEECDISAVKDYSLMKIDQGRQSLVAMQDALVRLATDREPQSPSGVVRSFPTGVGQPPTR
ncbi:MAG TPA: hypothetical protein VH482_32430 [Thermomicrobiales bacterium]|jgi:hypothetical protein